jgi:hypothetical protein
MSTTTITTPSFTKNEKIVLDSFISLLYAEAGFSDVDAHDLSRDTGISTRSIRGILSSLVKKGIIFLEETDNCWAEQQYVIIYLREEYYHLHPEWSKS